MKRHWTALLGAVAIYLIFFAHWYNSEISIEDEAGFVNRPSCGPGAPYRRLRRDIRIWPI